MAEAQLQIFLEKVRQLNAFVALSETDPQLRQELRDCEHHDEVVALARRCGFEIGRRWGEAQESAAQAVADRPDVAPTCDSQASSATDAATPRSSQAQSQAAEPGLRGDSGSLLEGPCPAAGAEVCEVLLQTPQWRLERIHSCEAASPQGFWYDQAENEWVTLLQGAARLRFEAEERDRELESGDSLLIPAGQRHRVNATDGPPGTIWLALFWSPP